jgi:cytochrome P450
MHGLEKLEPVRLDRALVDDPQSVYRRLRQEGPVQPVILPRGVPGWLVTSYADARALLGDPRLSKDIGRALALGLFPAGTADSAASPLSAHMLHSDPPDHTRLRRLVNKAFTSRAVSRLRPRIELAADELLDAMPAAAPFDLVDAYAFPLPIIVICELLGVPAHDRDDFRVWTQAFVASAPPEDLAQAEQQITQYLTALIDAKRAAPADDLLSGLVHVSDQGSQLSGDEILKMAFLLLVAGFETTANLIANGVLALMRHPDQLALLRSDPSLLPNAVEEFLRFDGPVNLATVRFTTEPVLVGGTEIPAGQSVMISLLAANRDGNRFAGPDRLDITRPADGHVAFGHGIHYCVGAPLARLEGQIAIGRLFSRFPALTFAAEPETLRWRRSILMHGVASLPVHTAGALHR